MEVSGRGSSTRPGPQHEQGSDEYSTGNQCEQCQEDELSVPADGYCADCGHYLCGSCIKLHRKLKMSKDHTLLTGRDMPHQKPQASGVEQCSKHPGKPIELYCPSDDTLGCYICFTIGHKSCQNVRPISDLSKDVESSKELKDIQTAAQQHEITLELYRKLISECHEINDSCYDKSLYDFQSFRADIEKVLDRLAVLVKTEAGALKETNKKNLDAVSERVTSFDKEMVSFMTDIEQKRKMKQKDQLFIALKANTKSINTKVQKLQEFKKDIQVQRYMFNDQPSIKEGLQQMLNTCIQQMSTVNITTLGEINVKSPDDKNKCFIASIVDISSTRLVASDHDNQCLKLIDVEESIIIKKRSLASGPGDVTVIPRSRVAVALPNQRILQFFTTDTGMEPCGHIGVDGQCHFVESTGDRLVVGYSLPSKVQIMNLSGQVLKSFTTDSSGNPLFGSLGYLNLSPDHSSIFISDCKNNTVTRMSTEGTIEWVYRNEEMVFPVGVTSGPDGCLYICSRDTDSVHVVSATGVRQAIFLEDQIMAPRAIRYSKSRNVLYVSSASSDPADKNFIRMFRLRRTVDGHI